MTTDRLIDEILKREGGYQDDPTDSGNAHGGATNFGITARTLGEWRRLGRQATKAEMKALTVEEARAIYKAQYVRPFEDVPFPDLQAALVDFGVNSGTVTAIEKLQEVLGVVVDGVLGPRTRTAMVAMPWKLTVNALVAARVKHCSELVEKDAKQRDKLRGWVKRAVSFYVH